jgi:hypothetical protein
LDRFTIESSSRKTPSVRSEAIATVYEIPVEAGGAILVMVPERAANRNIKMPMSLRYLNRPRPFSSNLICCSLQR